MDDPFVPVRVRRQGKMIPATLVGAGIMLMLIETRWAEILNQAQDLNSLLQNIVKQLLRTSTLETSYVSTT